MSKRKTTSEIVIHCSATYADMDIGVAEIDSWHKDRGWSGCGYHYIVRRDGTPEIGRDITKKGAHCFGLNQRSVGICLVGGLRKPKGSKSPYEDNFTKEQKDTLADLLRVLRRGYPATTILGHNEYDKRKACPVFNVDQFLKRNKIPKKGTTLKKEK